MEPPILKTSADFILQLTNSVTVKPREWADLIGKKFPYARVHRHRRPIRNQDLAVLEDRATPGTVVISDSKTSPSVITLYNQFLPGEIGSLEYQIYSDAVGYLETAAERLDWFTRGLEQIGLHSMTMAGRKRVSIAVPPLVDPIYRSVLGTFQDRYRQFIEVWLY